MAAGFWARDVLNASSVLPGQVEIAFLSTGSVQRHEIEDEPCCWRLAEPRRRGPWGGPAGSHGRRP